MSWQNYYIDKTIIITGGNSGIGLDFIRQLKPLAKKLICIDVEGCNLNEDVEFFQADVGNDEQMQEIAHKIQAIYEVDLIVANAGIDGSSSAIDYDISLNRKVTDVNYLGVVNSTAPFLKKMAMRKSGHIVGISSIGVFRGIYQAAPYFSAKAAMTVYLESLRLELNSYGVKVTTVFPGFIRTPISCDSTLPSIFPMDSDKAVLKMLKGIAKRRSGIYFPWQLRLICFFNRNLPNWLFDFFALKALQK